MNRRSFFKLALGGVAATAVAVALPAILNPEVPKTTAYRTYIMGENAVFNGRPFSEPLTLADIRRCVEELKSRNVKPVDNQFYGWVHPDREAEVAEWIRYKWKYKWTVGNS